ncbi:hypothetical protein [Kutzneria albida]|uniref:Uncharacterized protein n=1 Tax=Kutzneria albida DSM 43870 TaxID=1449976 RepID=W5WLN6_9PSEU|nr:hypothetical protein [Kutzneria albida]AHI01666.1 hypothetical protein KALB_8309 [Kutzneria albida DSM 43870]
MVENAALVEHVEWPGSTEPPVPTRWARFGLDTLPVNRRRWLIAVVVIALLITLIGLLLVVGAWRDDKWIESRPGVQTAEVLSTAFDRTVVRFNTPDGAVHIPIDGVLYPQGLSAGQLVRVEYDSLHPDALVRVAGRTYTLTFLPVGMILAITWAIAAGLIWWLRRPTPTGPTPATR